MGDDAGRRQRLACPTRPPMGRGSQGDIMKRYSTPGRRALLVCIASLGLFAAPAMAGNTCPEVKFGGSGSLSVPDFDPVTGGGWIPHRVTVNGQPSSPGTNQGGVYQWTQVSGPAVALINANTTKVDFD